MRAALHRGLVLLAGALLAACSAGSVPEDFPTPPAGSGGTLGIGGTPGGGQTGGYGGSSSTGGSSGAGTGGAAGPSDAAAAADAGIGADAGAPPPPACSIIQLTALIPHSVPQGAKLRLRAQSSSASDTAWIWSVRREGDPLQKTIPSVPSLPSEVEVVLADLGLYHVTAAQTGGCSASLDFVTVSPRDAAHSYWLRAIPPLGLAAAPYTTGVSVVPGQADLDMDLPLADAVAVVLDPVSDGSAAALSAAVPSYVRLDLPQAGLRLEGYTRDHAFMVWLAPGMTYEALVIPDADLAPLRFGDITTFSPRLVIDAGMTVSGTVTGPAGPVADARVLLRNGDLPSTVGVASAKGAYTVHARGDQLGATVFPPVGSSLPQARLDAGKITFTAPATKLDFAWKALPPGNPSITVRTVDGTAPAARVPVRLSSALPDVGTFHAGSGADFSASGLVTLEGSTDAAGAVPFSSLPVGSYTLTLSPPDGAVTVLPVEVSAAGPPQTVRLARQIKVTGSVTPAGLGAGATVIAVDPGADPTRPTPAALIGDGGQYVLLLDPGPAGGERPYRLFVEPDPAHARPRVALGQVIVADQDLTVEARPIPTGIPLRGTATWRGRPLAGVFVQIYCADDAPDCVNLTSNADQRRPISEANTDASGKFELFLPDPASLFPK